MSEPISGNHNNLHQIEVQFAVVSATLEHAEISIEGLFLNVDAGFDSKSFRDCCKRKEIQANVCFNKSNGNTENRDEYFDQDI